MGRFPATVVWCAHCRAGRYLRHFDAESQGVPVSATAHLELFALADRVAVRAQVLGPSREARPVRRVRRRSRDRGVARCRPRAAAW